MHNFLVELIRVSEKSANIARVIRAKKELFSLLVEEKDVVENSRFVRDFKTLADVLIQETIRHDLTTKFPSLNPLEIRGEESNQFTNVLGDSISVDVQDTVSATAELLTKVLDNNVKAAEILASVVHSSPQCLIDQQHLSTFDTFLFPLDQFGIWIDPIDSTAEYIHGKDETPTDDICSSGLPCVTILIGVFHRGTGEPLIGVVNQPFHKFDSQENLWRGRCEWGINYGDYRMSSFQNQAKSSSPSRVLLSGCEDERTKQILLQHYEVLYAAGAGYKILCVALGAVDVYILSKSTTFRWDLCAPHALLSSCGGGIVCYDAMMKTGAQLQVRYDQGKEQRWCNTGGIIAYRDHNVAKHLSQLLKDNNCHT